jgi:paraquat-inducible protein B
VNTIPSTQSMMKNLEDSLVHAVDRFPEIADQVIHVLGQLSRLLDSLDQRNLGAQAGDTLANANRVVEEIRSAVHGLDTEKLSVQAQATMSGLNEMLARTSALVDRLQSDKGVVASAERAASAVGDMAHGARGLGTEVEDTLQEVRDAAAAIKELGDSLERDPDMLLKGKSRVSR